MVRVRLMNGDTYHFSVVFLAMTIHGACECGALRAADNSVPMLTDAGVDSL